MAYALLIVDDNPGVLRALQRLLRRYFEDVALAENPEQALVVLEGGAITHVICDNDLGSQAHGIDLIPLWRRQFPDIERVILYTGCDIHAAIPSEIDAVVLKSDDPNDVRDALFSKHEVASGVRDVLDRCSIQSSRTDRRISSG